MNTNELAELKKMLAERAARIAALEAQNAELIAALEVALHRADQARYHTAETIEPITAEWLEGIITTARAAIASVKG